MKRMKTTVVFLSLLTGLSVISCMENYIAQPSAMLGMNEIPQEIPMDSIGIYNAFTAGVDNVNSYRIPSLVTANNGNLLLFCEARKVSWRDKSPTDIVLKVSNDNGVTWSAMKVLLSGGNDAYMDPVAIVDKSTGRIFLYSCLWPEDDVSMINNTAWMMYSDDHGDTWSNPNDMTAAIIPAGFYITGFGPGSGFQMSDQSDYGGRLIVPIRLSNGTVNRNRTLYSDNHGSSWGLGQQMSDGGEFQIAESPFNTLIYNRRGNATRYRGFSSNGGINWTTYQLDTALQSVGGGCQGSVFGIDSVLFFTGPAGGNATVDVDNRANLTLYRSLDGGLTWNHKQLLYDGASGYSCITQLNNGDIAIVFESADTQGFIKSAVRGYNWMRLDMIIIPKEVLNKDYWFNSSLSTYFELDGSTYISIPHDDALNIASGESKTYTMWYKPVAGAGGRILNKRAGTTTGYELVLNSTMTMAANIRSNSNTNIGTANSTAVIEPNKWNHITFMYDQTDLTKLCKIYLNGSLLVQSTTMAQTSNQAIESSSELLFGTPNAKTTFLSGAIDNIRIYNKALNVSEILDDMQTLQLSDYADVIAEYDFEDINGSNVVENKANSQHHGIAVGSVKTNQRIVQ